VTRHLLRTSLLTIVLLMLASALGASTHRAVAPPSGGDGSADVLGIGPMSGASVSGSVASVQGTTITLNSGGAAAIRVDASAAKFLGDQGSGSIGDVKPGVRITAFINTSVTVAAGAALPAQLITIESFPDLTVTGSVQAVDVGHSTFTVLGINIAVDANTAFSSVFPTFAAVKFSDLAVGQVVNVTAAFAGGSILAKRVQLLSFSVSPTVTLHGTVKSISATAWVITAEGKDTTVTVNAQTKIVGDPKVGDVVQVMANVDSAHNYVAVAIIKLGPPGPPVPGTVELHGVVKTISATQWTVGGPSGTLSPDYLVKITATTQIYPNPAVGDHVEVTGTRDSTGALVAQKITKQD
jgi:hypothetical protein